MFLRAVALAGLLSMSLTGCGSGGPDLQNVGGRITMKGEPVPNASVTFVPQGEGGSPSYGMTDADGRYQLRFTQQLSGALPGPHDVTIRTERYSPDDLEALRRKGLPITDKFVRIPAKYGRPGELTAVVEKGTKSIDFDLEEATAGN